MYSQPPTATNASPISAPQGNLPLPVATTSSVCDVSAALDLPTSLSATDELNTTQDSVASDASFPVVSIPNSEQHQSNLSDLDTSRGGQSPNSDGTECSDTPTVNGQSNTSASSALVNGTEVKEEQLYSKRSVP